MSVFIDVVSLCPYLTSHTANKATPVGKIALPNGRQTLMGFVPFGAMEWQQIGLTLDSQERFS